MIRSRHGLASRLDVCPVPSTVTRRPDPSSLASPSAHATGVAGSPVVPTTTIGGAVGALTAVGVGFTGGTRQYAHGTPSPRFDAPKYGAWRAASAWSAGTVAASSSGPSRQEIARNAAHSGEYRPAES